MNEKKRKSSRLVVSYKIAAFVIIMLFAPITVAAVLQQAPNPGAQAAPLKANWPHGATGAIGAEGPTGANVTANQPIGSYSYLIGQWSNGTYYAKNGVTNVITLFSTDPTVLINSVIPCLPSNGQLDISEGNYALDNLTSIVDASNPNIVLQGIGNPVFTVPDNFDLSVFSISAQNVTISGLTINASGQQSNASNGAIMLEPTATDCTVKNNFITGATTGVMISDNDSTVSRNTVLNSIHDGITIEGGTFSDPGQGIAGGDKISILDNFVKGSQIYNGISLVAATNCLVSGNNVVDPMSNGIALENFGYGVCSNDVITSNSVTNVQEDNGLDVYISYNNASYTAQQCQFVDNSISNASGGIFVGYGQNLLYNNTRILNVQNGIVFYSATPASNTIQFSRITINEASNSGMKLENAANLAFNNIVLNNIGSNGIGIANVTDVTFSNYGLNGVAGDGIVITNPAQSITFTNGVISKCAGSQSIYVSGASVSGIDFENTTIVNPTNTCVSFAGGNQLYFRNGFLRASVTPGVIDVRISGATSDWTFSGNTVTGATGTGIYVTTTANAGNISDNIFSSTTGYVHAVWLAGSGGDILVQNNKIAFLGTLSVAIYNQETNTGANYDTIANNDLHLSTVSIINQNPDYTKILNNVGYNP